MTSWRSTGQRERKKSTAACASSRLRCTRSAADPHLVRKFAASDYQLGNEFRMRCDQSRRWLVAPWSVRECPQMPWSSGSLGTQRALWLVFPTPSPSEANVMRSVNIGGNRYGSLVSTPWGEIVPDAIGAFGVVVAASAAWLSQRVSSRSVSVSKTVAAIEQDRRNTVRVPRLSARLETWGTGQSAGLPSIRVLNVYADSGSFDT